MTARTGRPLRNRRGFAESISVGRFRPVDASSGMSPDCSANPRLSRNLARIGAPAVTRTRDPRLRRPVIAISPRTIAADPRHFGALIGFFAVLHTWGQTLVHHPCLHCVVPGVNHSHRSPHGNRQMRRLLNQAAHAAMKPKGSIFELAYRGLVVRLGHKQAIGAITHRLGRLVWKILHDGVTYEERGPAVTKARAQRRAAKMLRELRSLGYRVERALAPANTLA